MCLRRLKHHIGAEISNLGENMMLIREWRDDGVRRQSSRF